MIGGGIRIVRPNLGGGGESEPLDEGKKELSLGIIIILLLILIGAIVYVVRK